MADLGDNDLMPFGLYKGKAMANVPASYLKWVKDEVKKNDLTKPVLKYIKKNWDAIEIELKKESQ